MAEWAYDGWHGYWLVSIPSQAGILLAGRDPATVPRQTVQVSIPSQAGILLAGQLTLRRTQNGWVSIPSQAGILLAGCVGSYP